MEKRKRLTCKSEISGVYFFRPDVTVLEVVERMGELEDMEEAMQDLNARLDKLDKKLAGRIEEITDALDDIINRRETC